VVGVPIHGTRKPLQLLPPRRAGSRRTLRTTSTYPVPAISHRRNSEEATVLVRLGLSDSAAFGAGERTTT
jgi:hypothetical protein